MWVADLCYIFNSFWRHFTIRMIKSVNVFAFSFWKLIMQKFASNKSTSWHNVTKRPSSVTTPWTLTLGQIHYEIVFKFLSNNIFCTLLESWLAKLHHWNLFRFRSTSHQFMVIWNKIIFSLKKDSKIEDPYKRLVFFVLTELYCWW